jgi:hypothetical protein
MAKYAHLVTSASDGAVTLAGATTQKAEGKVAAV